MTKLIENKQNIRFKDKKEDLAKEKNTKFLKIVQWPLTLKGNKYELICKIFYVEFLEIKKRAKLAPLIKL